MNLSPRDLGTEHFLTVVRRRLTPLMPGSPGQTLPPLESAKPRPRSRTKNRLIRYWLGDLISEGELYDKTADLIAATPSFSGSTAAVVIFSILFLLPAFVMLLAQAPFPLFLLFTLIWAITIWGTIVGPRTTIRRAIQASLQSSELESLQTAAQGRLARSHITLALDAMRHSGQLSASAQSDIRAALSALGDAISRLPSGPVPTADPTVLRREAEDFRLQAGRENDAFVRASFLRQAESLEKRADLGLENATSARRISALRREARTQMDALRALLAAFSQTNPGEAAQNVALADAVSRVTGEAQAISQAHRELADAEIAALLGHPLPANLPVQPTPSTTPPVSQTQTYPTRQPAGGSQSNAPQQQVGSGRPWWRG